MVHEPLLFFFTHAFIATGLVSVLGFEFSYRGGCSVFFFSSLVFLEGQAGGRVDGWID